MIILKKNENPKGGNPPSEEWDYREPNRIPYIWNPANAQLGLPELAECGYGATLDLAVIPHTPVIVVRGLETVSDGLFMPSYADSMQVPSAIMGQAWGLANRGGR